MRLTSIWEESEAASTTAPLDALSLRLSVVAGKAVLGAFAASRPLGVVIAAPVSMLTLLRAVISRSANDRLVPLRINRSLAVTLKSVAERCPPKVRCVGAQEANVAAEMSVVVLSPSLPVAETARRSADTSMLAPAPPGAAAVLTMPLASSVWPANSDKEPASIGRLPALLPETAALSAK